jgi:GntR family transcriptional regulator
MQIRDDLVRRISASEWAPDQAIPTEAELSQYYGVSIGTIRKAVDLLVSDRLLNRSQGRGTFVCRPRFDSSLFRFFRFKTRDGAEVKPRAQVTGREQVVPPDDVRDALRMAKGERSIHLSRLRLIEEHPVLLEDIWLPPRGFEPLTTLELSAFDDLLYPLYESLCGLVVASATETLRVGRADAHCMQALHLSEGAPVIDVQRVAMDYTGRPLEWRRTWGAAEGFEYQIDLR